MLLTTFGLTVLVDLTVAISVGMILASFLFVRRMAEITEITEVRRDLDDEGDGEGDFDGDIGAAWRREIPDGVRVYEIRGPFFFGAAEVFKEALTSIADRPRVLILRMRHVWSLDSSAVQALRDIVRRSRREGTQVLLCEVQRQPLAVLRSSEALDEIDPANVLPDIETALACAIPLSKPTASSSAG